MAGVGVQERSGMADFLKGLPAVVRRIITTFSQDVTTLWRWFYSHASQEITLGEMPQDQLLHLEEAGEQAATVSWFKAEDGFVGMC